MDKSEDVERLFSWLKAPMVHYREFAPQIEVAEAVATWPLVHKAAVRTGVASENEPAPRGDAAVKERMARERAAMPPAAAEAIRETPMPGTEAFPMPSPPPGRLADRPTGDGVPPPVQHAASGYSEPAPESATYRGEPQRPVPPAANETGFPPAAEPRMGARQAPHYQDAGQGQGALFGGEYREREREPTPRRRPADRQDRSLDAVFTRLSGGRDRLPDPRDRARTSPGLGAVFGRLR